MLKRLLAAVIVGVVRVLRWSWRVQVCGDCRFPDGMPVVFCFWHGRQSGLLAYSHFRRLSVLCSWSNDGQLQAHVMRRFGFLICRGSSSRGGAEGLKRMVRAMKNGVDATVAVDGPRGPLHVAKKGAIEAARHAGGVLVPITFCASRSLVFAQTWDQFVLPKPFSRVRIVVGDALFPEKTTPDSLTMVLRGLDAEAEASMIR